TVGAVMAATATDGWAVAHRGALVAEQYLDGGEEVVYDKISKRQRLRVFKHEDRGRGDGRHRYRRVGGRASRCAGGRAVPRRR
ncbi:hypothetical protein HGO75_24750, partial [Mycobacterium tuberculosis]|nr:hypothetical protein [Mycobacterium tuberculosis]